MLRRLITGELLESLARDHSANSPEIVLRKPFVKLEKFAVNKIYLAVV